MICESQIGQNGLKRKQNWGTISLPKIAKNLNRSVDSILNKKQQLGLASFLDSGDYVTFNQLIQALGRPKSNTYMATSWIKNRGLPVHYKKVRNNRFKVVSIKDFWKWAEKNRTFIDFSKVPENALGKEPGWVKQQRKAEQKRAVKYRSTPWTPQEDQMLTLSLKRFCYTYAELSRMLGRTCGAISRRICDLGLKERPLKADNHATPWTQKDLSHLRQLILSGIPYPLMAEKLNRSEKAIRGKVWTIFHTENLDKVRWKLQKEGVA